MVIAYLLEVDPYSHTGIIKKVNDQVALWRAFGHEVSVYLNWPREGSDSSLCISGYLMEAKILRWLPKGFAKNYLNKIFSSNRLYKELKTFSPDLLYMRQNTWYPGLTKILQEHKVILELNSVDEIEARFYNGLKRLVYLAGRDRVLAHADGLVAVTPDIFKYYHDFPNTLKEVISNGIDLDRTKTLKVKGNDGVNFVFVGSKNSTWHGLGKIIDLAKVFPDYSFNIVGSSSEDYPNSPKNVTFHGWLDARDLKQVYMKNDIGLGSFKNHLVGKEIDSTLKVREYLAHGLPVIAGHWDVDFLDVPFFKKITNSEGVFFEKPLIREIVETLKNYIVNKEEVDHISSKNKELQRLGFFKKVCQQEEIK